MDPATLADPVVRLVEGDPRIFVTVPEAAEGLKRIAQDQTTIADALLAKGHRTTCARAVSTAARIRGLRAFIVSEPSAPRARRAISCCAQRLLLGRRWAAGRDLHLDALLPLPGHVLDGVLDERLHGERRRYYELTEAGRRRLREEVSLLGQVMAHARARG